MTDPWSRDGEASRERGPVFDIPLAGDGPLVEQTDEGASATEPTNWRKVVGVAGSIGVVLGLLVGVGFVVFTGDDGDQEDDGGAATGTTVEPTELTTPPTLSPLEELPPPGTVEVEVPGVPSGQGVPSVPSVDAPATPFIEFEEVPEGTADVPEYLTMAAIAQFGEDLPRRSSTTYTTTVGGGSRLDMRINRDPNTDRYLVSFVAAYNQGEASESRVTVDMAAGYLYQSTTADEPTMRQPIEADLAPNGFSDLGEFLDAMLLGPLRPDTFDSITSIEPGTLVRFLPGEYGRKFVVELPASSVIEWSRFAFGTSSGNEVEFDATVRYEVYVDAAGSIVLVQGSNAVDDGTQTIIHMVETLDSSFAISLPSGEILTSDGIDTQASEDLRLTHVPLADDMLGDVDIDAALSNLAVDPPLRSVVTDIDPGAGFTITTEFDAASGLTATTVAIADLEIRQIEDVDAGRVFRRIREGERWVSEPLDATSGRSDRRFLTGLVSADLLSRSPVSTGGVYALEDGTVVREFLFSVEASELDLPPDVTLQLLLEQPVTVHVYVDDQQRVHEQQVLSNSDGSPEVLIQQFAYLDDAPVVTLPDPADVDEL